MKTNLDSLLFLDWIYLWSSLNYLILCQYLIFNNCFLAFVLSSLVYSKVVVISPSIWFTKVPELSFLVSFLKNIFHFLDDTHRSIESQFDSLSSWTTVMIIILPEFLTLLFNHKKVLTTVVLLTLIFFCYSFISLVACSHSTFI